MEDSQKKLGKALKRNLESQNKTVPIDNKTTSSNLPAEETSTDTEENLEE